MPARASGDRSSTQLSQILRRQLHDLRIDPDGVFRARRPLLARFKTWRKRHSEATLWIGFTTLVVLVVLIIVTSLVLSQSARRAEPTSRFGAPQLQNAPTSAARSTQVSLGPLTLRLALSSYQALPMGQTALVLHVEAQNTGSAVATLAGGDMLLVDRQGALFPPSWRDTFGTHDGIGQSDHTLLALDPGAAEQLEVAFDVVGEGPFLLRLQQHGLKLETSVPGL